MQLKIQRSQRQSGLVSKAVVFCVDARIFLTAEEQANVTRYKLGSQIIYSSEAAKRHAASAEAHQNAGQAVRSYGLVAKGLLHAIASRMALNITIASLQNGQHIECKDLNEVVDAEDALMTACENLKGYLQTAATFDGREVVIDFSKDEPEAVSKPVALAAPIAPAPIVQSTPAQETNMGATMSAPGAAPAATASFALAYTRGAPPPETNPFQPALDWWNGLTYEQRKWIVIVGGAVVLFILYKTI